MTRLRKSFFSSLLPIACGLAMIFTMPVQALDLKKLGDPVKPKIPADAPFHATVRQTENASDLATSQSFPDAKWWQGFGDENLNRYIEEALVANRQLNIARARVNEARAVARLNLAGEFPLIKLSPSVTRLRNSATQIPGGGGFGNTTTGTGGTSAASGGSFFLGTPFTLYSVPLQASYEADFFLKKRDQTRALNKQADAAEFDAQTVAIAVSSDVAGTYFNLLAEDKLIALQKQYIDVSTKDLEVERERFNQGLVSQETVAVKESLVTDARAALQDYYRLQSLYSHQLSILMGKTPEEVQLLPRGDIDNFSIPASVDTGIPSELITRRPDILSAERGLESSRLNVRAARKELLPTFNFSGTVGFTTASFSKLFNWQSRIMTLAASAAQTLFDAGARRANTRIYQSRYEQQLGQYSQVILNAFREVDDALESLQAHRNAYNSYTEGIQSLNRQLGILNLQYEAGAIAGADRYAVQREIIQAQEGLVSSKILGMVDTLNLYKALGGGY